MLRFEPTLLPGVLLVRSEPIRDDRGWFTRSWCRASFAAAGLDTAVDQCSLSFNERRGTLRGMHLQVAPHEEIKVVRVVRGRVFDVVVDLRPASPTFTRWFGVELDRPELALYIPAGLAHGFQTLEDQTLVTYQMSTSHAPESATGVRWDDPVFGIDWPIPQPSLSERDAAWPDFVPSRGLGA